jgi:hypothetical protein
MSFNNPYREALKEDVARQHFEDHELSMLPMHVNLRRETAERKKISVRELEERLFQEWIGQRRRNGFANFDTDWIDSDNEEA